jgi:hypothetical protein
MTTPDNSAFLARAAAERHTATLQRANEAIELLDRSGAAITFFAVARAARVSRAWLYRNEEVRATIDRLRSTSPPPTTPAGQRATVESLHERLDAGRHEIARLRNENTELRDRLARTLGERRARH